MIDEFGRGFVTFKLSLGEASLKKNGKIWDNVPIRVDPPSPSDI